MAVLRQGSVITATVEQSLGNCLLVHFKHRSRTFRGILFDEKNSVVQRATITKQSDDHKLMSNKSSLPLGMAIVSPSKQPYSSLRNRIYYNTTSKRFSGSNSKSNGSKNSENKGHSQTYSGSSGKDTVNCRESSAQTHRKPGQDGLNKLDTRHSSRSFRQRCKNATSEGNGLKRKAEYELEGSKPTKSRSNVKETTSTVNWNSSKHVSHTQQKPSPNNSTRRKIIVVGSESSNKSDSTENEQTLFPCEEQSETTGINANDINTTSTLSSVRQNLFPPEYELKTNNVFINDQTEIQGMKECVMDSGSDGAVDFFGSLGLGSACHDRDDGNEYVDSNASCSSNEQLGERPDLEEEEKDSLKNESEEIGPHEDETYYEAKTEGAYDKQQSLTPTKKSARISAKRAILEQNLSNYNDDNTIWSIWGGAPSQKEKDQQHSLETEVPVDSPESLPEIVHVDVSENGSSANNIPLCSTGKTKGPRMKQTPVRAKVSNNVCIPEKQVSVGSIVWGKVHGHPWWPGRVLAVSGNFGEGSETTKHAHVTWFGSNTSSIMPVNELQHFVANFKRRHKKTKKGCYRKAVRQAQDMLQIMGEEF